MLVKGLNKNIRQGVIVCCLLPTAMAFSMPSSPFNGYYVGAEFGESLAYANQTIQNNVDLQFSGFSFISHQPFNIQSSMVTSAASGALFVGHGHVWNRFYLGGELALSNSYYKMSSSADSGIIRNVENFITISGHESVNTTANVSPTQLGVFLRPGVMLTPTSLLYGRVGTSVVNVRYNTTNVALKTLSQSGTSIDFPITLKTNKTINRAAFQIGTGLEQAINDKLTVRLDYLYSYYGTIQPSAEQSTTIDTFFLTSNGTQSVGLHDQSIMLGLAYHMNA